MGLIMKHSKKCPLYQFTYEVGSGQDIPDCNCKMGLEDLKIEVLHKFNSCSATEKLLLLTFIDWLKHSGWIGEKK